MIQTTIHSMTFLVIILIAMVFPKRDDGMPQKDFPILPPKYHSNWTFFSVSFSPNDPLRTIEGETYYDYGGLNERRLLEIWKDDCVPIWPDKNNKPRGECHFLNVPAINGTGTSYLRYRGDDGKLNQCCIFAMPWEGVEPDFLKHFEKSEAMSTDSLDWYTAQKPPAGPFTYAFLKLHEKSAVQVPFAFGFAIIDPVQNTPGYGTHQFYNVNVPGPSFDWNVPDECKKQVPKQGGPFPGYNCPFSL